MVGNTRYEKRRISRTKAVHGKRNITFTPILAYVPDQLDAFFNPKNAAKMNPKSITWPSIGQLEKRKSSRATDVV